MVRVWDCVGEGATKGEYAIISGRINDLAWDGDSQRIIAVGDGKERKGHCITADSGNSVGEISGHSALINSVSIRQQRPLRAATGSDDKTMVFYHGAPFKFNTSLRGKHANTIWGTSFSPDGSKLVSVGSDSKIWIYDGKTGEAEKEIGGREHKGSIFGVSWSKDSKKIVTASADKTVKIWDVEAGKVVQSWTLGSGIPDQQVGVVWPQGRSDNLIISLSLSGDLNYFIEGEPSPVRIVHGHQKNITTVDHNKATDTLWSGSSDGRVCCWDIGRGLADSVKGEGHSNYVSAITTAPNDPGKIYSAGWDDTLRPIDISSKTYTEGAAKLQGQPRGVAAAGNRTVIATPNGVETFSDGKQTQKIDTSYTPTSISAHGNTIAVGGDDSLTHLYDISSSSTPKPTQEIASVQSTAITAVAFSPDGSLLAVGNSTGKIVVYSPADGSVVTDRWGAHTARITSIAWNADGTFAVSGSLDTNVFVWSLKNPGLRVKAANAHKEGVNCVAWVEGDRKVVSSGADATIKLWKIEGLS